MDKYYNERYKKVSIKFNKETEKEMIENLDKRVNTSGYIKYLIKKDMNLEVENVTD